MGPSFRTSAKDFLAGVLKRTWWLVCGFALNSFQLIEWVSPEAGKAVSGALHSGIGSVTVAVFMLVVFGWASISTYHDLRKKYVALQPNEPKDEKKRERKARKEKREQDKKALLERLGALITEGEVIASKKDMFMMVTFPDDGFEERIVRWISETTNFISLNVGHEEAMDFTLKTASSKSNSGRYTHDAFLDGLDVLGEIKDKVRNS